MPVRYHRDGRHHGDAQGEWTEEELKRQWSKVKEIGNSPPELRSPRQLAISTEFTSIERTLECIDFETALRLFNGQSPYAGTR